MSAAAAERPQRRMVRGLENIAKALRLPAGTDVRQLRRWIRREGLPVFKIAGQHYADPEELDAWRERKRVVLAIAHKCP